MGVLQENFVPVGGTGNSQLCSGLNGLASKLSVKIFERLFLESNESVLQKLTWFRIFTYRDLSRPFEFIVTVNRTIM